MGISGVFSRGWTGAEFIGKLRLMPTPAGFEFACLWQSGVTGVTLTADVFSGSTQF